MSRGERRRFWLPWYFRARLQRRIFLSFGLSIAITAVVLVVFSFVAGAFESPWRREAQQLHRFVGQRFARVWDDPASRDDLGESMAKGFDVTLTLLDPRRREITHYGPPCKHAVFVADVVRGEHVLGYVRVCHEPPNMSWRFYVGIVLIPVSLWAASGFIARKLSRPLLELTRVAEEIGRGKLSSRVRLRHGDGEVGVLADVMNEMASRVEKQMADQRALLATVSHEIRTPLARMRLLVEMAKDAKDEKILADLDREVVEMDALVAELLASSRIDFSALSVTELDPRELATRAVERAGVDPTLLAADEGVPKIKGDATLLGRAALNLLENAKRHAGGPTAFTIAARPGFVVLAVEDEGPGLREGEETKIFEPFYKGKEDGRSVGLGLALVKRIAEAHGGRAFAENREGKGARIGFEVAVAGPSAVDESSVVPPFCAARSA